MTKYYILRNKWTNKIYNIRSEQWNKPTKPISAINQNHNKNPIYVFTYVECRSL